MTSRRDQVPFDPQHYEKLAPAGREAEPEHTFRDIYRRHHWSGSESASGAGASPDQTRELRRSLPALLSELGVATMLDLPCGDYGWMRTIDLPVARYIGADLLPEIVEPLAAAFGDGRREFRVLDLTRDRLPLDLERAPFHLPAPMRILNEGCTEGRGVFADKSLGLWRTADLGDLPFLKR